MRKLRKLIRKWFLLLHFADEDEGPSADSMLGALFGTLDDPPAPADIPPTEPPADPDPKPPAEPPAEPPADEPPPPAPIKVRKRKADTPAEPPPPPPPPPPDQPPPADNWEDDLVEEERDYLETARNAEKYFPDKYKGFSSKMEKFIRDNKAKTEAADFDPDSDEYRDWVDQARPKLTMAEVRRIDRKVTEAELNARHDERNREVLDKTFKMSQEPLIRAKADAAFQKALAAALPDDVKEAYKESAEKAKTEFAMEYGIAEDILNRHADDVEELYRLTTHNPDTQQPIAKFDRANPNHGRVWELVLNVENAYKQAGKDLVRDGKQFATRSQLSAIPQDKRSGYWVLPIPEVVDRSVDVVKQSIAAKINAENQRMESLGYVRKRKDQAAPAPAPDSKTSTPAAPRTRVTPPNPETAGDSQVSKALKELGISSS